MYVVDSDISIGKDDRLALVWLHLDFNYKRKFGIDLNEILYQFRQNNYAIGTAICGIIIYETCKS
jgi:hypothetical protein